MCTWANGIHRDLQKGALLILEAQDTGCAWGNNNKLIINHLNLLCETSPGWEMILDTTLHRSLHFSSLFACRSQLRGKSFIFYRNIQMSTLASDKRVRCTLDEPIERLMQKLSTKSSELSAFWQNYNLLYSLYSEKTTQVETLKLEISHLRAQPVTTPAEVQMFKQREWKLERQFEDLRSENERLRQKLSEAQLTNHRLMEENISFEALIRQFRDQNHIQKENIDKILARLQKSEDSARVSNESKFMAEEQLIQLKKSQLMAGDLKRQLADKDSQISLLIASIQDYKREFERILTEAMRNCKIRLCESLPDIIQASKVTSIQKSILISNV